MVYGIKMKKLYKPRKPKPRWKRTRQDTIESFSFSYENYYSEEDEKISAAEFMKNIKKIAKGKSLDKIKVGWKFEYFAKDWQEVRLVAEWEELEPKKDYDKRMKKYKDKLKAYNEWKAK